MDTNAIMRDHKPPKNLRSQAIASENFGLAGAIQDGLRAAVERKDLQVEKFAAKMQLGAVDFFEECFNSAVSGRNPRK
jgi:hypothetical protein